VGKRWGVFPRGFLETIHETYGMVAGVTNRADAPGFTVENFTSFAYGKGVSMDAGGDTGWTIRNVHVVYGRDDCIENDWYNSGLIDSSFFRWMLRRHELVGRPRSNRSGWPQQRR